MLSPETELTLGLPGREARGPGLKTVRKRGYLDGDDWSTKSQELVGWPPVKAYRRNTVVKSCNKYVKVAVDGAPYLRKVDVERYDSYEQLLSHLENMFSCFTIGNCLKVGEINDQVNGIEYVATYEDKDGDWMLLGDVPWKLFVETCKRVRLMAPSEATGLDLRSPEKCTTG